MVPQNALILVVDDSTHMRRLIVDCLKQIGFKRYITAEDATEAFAELTFQKKSSEKVDIILSDLNMPGPSGIEFLKQVRNLDGYKETPFILITTESEKQSVIEAAVSGVSSYIVKPFDIKTLSQRMVEAWDKHNS